jgi:mono/diheme cytochrome c family protein/glucose/arabinose dehydrogenase
MMICRIPLFKSLLPLFVLALLAPSVAQAIATTQEVAPLPTTNPNFKKNPKLSPPSPPDVKPPPTSQPVPLLSPEDEITTMHLQPGFHMEVVAAEPMVEHPVQISWDPDGRLYVVEMRGYMPNIPGEGEDKPVCRISLLEDTDGDGRMDKSSVYWDKLVMPRTVRAIRDGVLIAVPPNLYFCRDTNHDGVMDEKTVVLSDYGMSDNVEHIANGLDYNIDNWMYSTSYDKRLRWQDGRWLTDPIPTLGQWGITHDSYGRIFHNTNSDHLRGSIFPPIYTDRNSHFHATSTNEKIALDQTCWPSHNTAENRGYMQNFLREDGTLRAFTAACSPMIYRGGLLKELEGNAFVCEASANIVRRDVITEKDAGLTAKNAYENQEFIASTYERFRPVNVQMGPDGAIYVVDMHHGLIQHRLSLTDWNAKNYLQRELQKYLLTGRIFRIVPDGAKLYPRPQLSKATWQELVETLSHPNGWWRDTAQRILIERGEGRAVPALRKLLAEDANPITRLHALWTLEGLGRLNTATLATALGDRDGKVRAAAIRVCEPILYVTARRAEILADVLKLASDRDPDVRLQFALTISAIGTPETDGICARIMTEDAESKYVREAILTGLRGREFDFLQRLMKQPEWSDNGAGRRDAIAALSTAVIAEANPKKMAELLDLIPAQEGENHWRLSAMLAGFPNIVKGRRVRSTLLDAPPVGLLALRRERGNELAGVLPRAFEIVHWPGDPAYVPPVPPRPLTVVEKERFELGRKVFGATCIQCHKADGKGQEGLAPPLLDSEWALGPERRVIRIVLQGVSGPISVNGRTYSYEMPMLAKLSDQEIAAALTYVRREWDHDADPVDPKTVTEVRAEVGNRLRPWSERELLQIP